jgi:hypothetical protein
MTDILPADYDRLAPWFNLLRQCNSLLAATGTMQIVTVTILIGPDGRPQMWSEPSKTRMYPRLKEIGEVGGS